MSVEPRDVDGDGVVPRSAVGWHPRHVLYAIAAVFSLGGVYLLPAVETSPTVSYFLFNGFLNVGLPGGVLVAAMYLRRYDLPESEWWRILGGYVTGISFMGVLMVWNAVGQPDVSLTWSYITDSVVVLGNLGGVFGFIIGVTYGHMRQIEELRTSLKQKNEALAQRNERLDDFAGVLTHDLRNSLTVAKGRLELVQEEYETNDTEAIAEALDRMNNIIDDTLLLAREGEAVGELTTIELDEIAHRCWTQVETGDATLKVVESATFQGDGRRLERVFENLFRNSIEHGGSDVTVTVGTLPDGFYIEDTGIGIPQAKRDTIFTSGYSTNPDGTGFGLSITQEVVRAHGWTIHAATSQNGGARFEIGGIDAIQSS